MRKMRGSKSGGGNGRRRGFGKGPKEKPKKPSKGSGGSTGGYNYAK